MTYELAKELKDAGFPIKPDGQIRLEDLIEACGDELRSVERFGENWAAFRKVEESYQGFTPEEAVARLWLSLHGSQSDKK